VAGKEKNCEVGVKEEKERQTFGFFGV